MTSAQEKVTAPVLSAATDNGQPQTPSVNTSIMDSSDKINYDFDAEFLRAYFQRTHEPDYLHTVSLTELYDTVYQPKAQIINNFLCSGVYLFVGAPKVGKSFFMAQLGYHVSGGERFSYASDYAIVTQLKQFVDQRNVCVLLVHHTRKQTADDCFETISGTNGLLGAADGAFILQKEKRTVERIWHPH